MKLPEEKQRILQDLPYVIRKILYDLPEYDQEAFLDGAVRIGQICDDMNHWHNGPYLQGMWAALQVQHRYLQAEAVVGLLRLLSQYREAGHDGRNERAVGFCQQLHGVLGERLPDIRLPQPKH
jgi:hypothetical protein